MSKKTDDFNMIVIHLLKKMNDQLKEINESNFEEQVSLELNNEIMIPTEIYEEICLYIESDNIDFMGIS